MGLSAGLTTACVLASPVQQAADTPDIVLGADLLQWVDAGLSERQPLNPNPISAVLNMVPGLDDLSGNGFGYVNPTISQQPIYESQGWDGEPSWAANTSNTHFTEDSGGAFPTQLAGGNDKAFGIWFALQGFKTGVTSVFFSCGANATTPFLDLILSSLDTYFASKVSGATKNVAATASSGGDRVVIEFLCNGTTLKIWINGVDVTPVSNDFDTSAAVFTRGGLFALVRNTTTTFFNGRIKTVVASRVYPSADQIAGMRTFMLEKIAPKTAPMLLINGDSLSRNDMWPAYTLTGYPNITQVNTSVAGRALFNWGVPYIARDGWSNFSASRSLNFYSFQWGSNDIVDGRTGLQIYNDFVSCTGLIRANNPGRKVMWATVAWRLGLTAGEEAQRQDINTRMRANPSQYDYLLERDLMLTAADYPALMPDGTHPNAQGNLYLCTGRNGQLGIFDYLQLAGFGLPVP